MRQVLHPFLNRSGVIYDNLRQFTRRGDVVGFRRCWCLNISVRRDRRRRRRVLYGWCDVATQILAEFRVLVFYLRQ